MIKMCLKQSRCLCVTPERRSAAVNQQVGVTLLAAGRQTANKLTAAVIIRVTTQLQLTDFTTINPFPQKKTKIFKIRSDKTKNTNGKSK